MYAKAKQGFKVICRHAFDQNEADILASREALRCVANALLLVEPTRDYLVDFDIADKAIEKLGSESTDDEFLLSRILFFLTYAKDSKPILEKIMDNEQLPRNLAAVSDTLHILSCN